MAKPIIQKILPFDASRPAEISLSWTGNRSHANRIIIYDSETNNLIFDDTVSTFALKHTIPANTLTNGKKYVIQAQTYDEENEASSLSDKVLFYTFETPDFAFSNIPEDGKVTNASFLASVNYYSSDYEDISTYKFYLYDSTKRQLLESNSLNDSTHINYQYCGLENNTVYYIRCLGVTVNGMELDTGFLEISVKYENPNAYARLYTTALPSQGCVKVDTNLIIIQYNGTEQFEYADGMINLVDKTLYYDEGFQIEDDFTIIIKGVNLWQNAEILKMSNEKHGLTLSSHIYHEGKLRFKLLVPNGVSSYLLYSDPQVFGNQDMVTIAIRRKNDVYQLKVFVELGFAPEGNIWYGTKRPTDAEKYDSWINVDGNTFMVENESYTTYLDDHEPSDAEVNDIWIGGA